MDRIELVLVIFLTISQFIFAADPPGGYYQTKYDSLDVEEILNNKRLVIHYVNCLLDRGACPPQGADLKRILPEALETNCLRCTEKQRDVIVRTIRRLRSEYPILWSELVSEYDPDGEYFVRFVVALDPTVQVEDQANVLSNRFGDENFPSDLFPTSPKPTPSPTTTKKTRRTYHTTRSSTSRPTRTEDDNVLMNIFTTLPPLFNRFSENETSTSKQTAEKSSTPQQTASTEAPLTYGWRPVAYGPRPQANRPQPPLVQGATNLISSLGQIGTRVIEAGTQVAGMVINAFLRAKRVI
ncbi:hypothetical protein RI129_002302 [Pyrocoelia pectoralis]|uniref:Uncharacterized protein n=1 Tax=Pyrocoelia pectoralis TaxID=417401 RepID=A0AAN7VF22_9COLE